MRHTVFLIDDHPVIAMGLRLQFRERQKFEIVGVAASPFAVEEQLRALEPDVIVADLAYAGVVRTDLIALCREFCPAALIVAFTSLPARIYEHATRKAGADAYFLKENDLEALERQLADLVAARNGASPAAAFNPLPDKAHSGVMHLTPREREIASLLGQGLSPTRIALLTGISYKTVSAHRDNLKVKLSCRDTTELVARLARFSEAARETS